MFVSALSLSLALSAVSASPQLTDGIGHYEANRYMEALQALTPVVLEKGHAAKDQATAHVYLGLIKIRYQQPAWDSFETALRLSGSVSIPQRGPRSDRARAHMYLGCLRSNQGRDPDEHFRAALRLDHNVDLPPRASKKAQQAFENFKKQQASQQRSHRRAHRRRPPVPEPQTLAALPKTPPTTRTATVAKIPPLPILETQPPPPPITPPVDTAATDKSDTWVWVAGGTATAAAVVGGVFLVMALNNHARSKELAKEDPTPSHWEPTYNTAKSQLTTSYVAFGVAGLAAGTALALHFDWFDL